MRETTYVLTLQEFRALPTECASCMEPAATVAVLVMQPPVWVPYCQRCMARVVKRNTDLLFFAATLVAGAVLAALPAILPFMRPDKSLVVVALSPLIGLAAWIASSLVKPRPPATALRSAVVLTRRFPLTLECTNGAWAKRAQELNDAYLRVSSRWRQPNRWVALFISLTGAAFVWMGFSTVYPKVHVDHAGSAAIDLWIDGDAQRLAPNGREEITLRPGKHTLAWSEPGKPPTASHEMKLGWSEAVLFNPGITACYWRSVEFYGSPGPADPMDNLPVDGPLSLAEIYTPKKVDVWLGKNPDTKKTSEGRTSVAIDRDPACTELLTGGCSPSIIELMIACERDARSPVDVQACYAEAKRACGVRRGITL